MTEIQCDFDSWKQNINIFNSISCQIVASGIDHAAKQRRETIRKLKQDYKKHKKTTTTRADLMVVCTGRCPRYNSPSVEIKSSERFCSYGRLFAHPWFNQTRRENEIKYKHKSQNRKYSLLCSCKLSHSQISSLLIYRKHKLSHCYHMHRVSKSNQHN